MENSFFSISDNFSSYSCESNNSSTYSCKSSNFNVERRHYFDHDDNATFAWEKLDIANECIQELEKQLDQTVDDVNELQIEWDAKLKYFENTLGNSIEKSPSVCERVDQWSPYRETRAELFRLHQEHQKTLADYERAMNEYETAQKRVDVSRLHFYSRRGPGYLEKLNCDIDSLNEAECKFYQSKDNDEAIMRMISETSADLRKLEKDFETHILQSKQYFDARAKFANELEEKNELMVCLIDVIHRKKFEYNNMLKCYAT